MIKYILITTCLVCLVLSCKKENEANQTPTAPILEAPQNGSLVSNDSILFNWTASKDAEGDDIQYTLFVSTDSLNWKFLDGRKNTSSIKVAYSGFAAGKKYYWKVSAANLNQNGIPIEKKSESSVFIFYTIPSGVKSLDITSANQSVELTWQDVENASSVEITFNPQVNGIIQPVKVNPGTGRLLLQGLQNEVVYSFFVKSIDKSGNSSLADTIEALPLLPNRVHDADFNIYNTVKIGNQIWLAQNLKAKHYSDGTPVDKAKVTLESKDGYGICYHPSVALNKVLNVAPKGFHAASDQEWKILEQTIGMETADLDILSSFNGINAVKHMTQRGTASKCGKALASTTDWIDYNSLPGNGTDFYHFNIYPTGYTFAGEGLPGFTGEIAHILTSTPTSYDTGVSLIRLISNQSDGIYRAIGFSGVYGTIRCVKDQE